MAFVKTTWNAGGPPGISAAQLNRIEQGIADAHSVIPTRYVVNQSADFDVTGLNGDTDYGYEIVCVGRMSTNGTFVMRPNGDAGANYAGLYNQTFRAPSSAVTNSVGATGGSGSFGLQIASSPGTVPYYIASRAVFSAKSQGGAYGRAFICQYGAKSEVATGESISEDVSMWWNPSPASTVVNKLTFAFGGATFDGHISVRVI